MATATMAKHSHIHCAFEMESINSRFPSAVINLTRFFFARSFPIHSALRFYFSFAFRLSNIPTARAHSVFFLLHACQCIATTMYCMNRKENSRARKKQHKIFFRSAFASENFCQCNITWFGYSNEMLFIAIRVWNVFQVL